MIPNCIKEHKLTPCVYDAGIFPVQNGLVINDENINRYTDIKRRRVEIRRTSLEKDTWCISYYGDVLSKDNEWVRAPLPSSSTEEFIEQTRFSSPEVAYEFYMNYLENHVYKEEDDNS